MAEDKKDALPVIIAGAGPVGLVAAATLVQRGVPVVVCEKRAQLNRASKASTFHPASLEVLQALGFVEELLTQGVRVETIQYRSVTQGVVAEFSMNILREKTRFPFRIHLEQSALTASILARLIDHPLFQIHFDCEVVGVENLADAVQVAVAGEGAGQRQLRGSYLLGADGARSALREFLNIDFPGSEYGTRVLRIFTPADLEQYIPGIAPLCYIFGENDSCSLLKMPDCWRIILRIPTAVGDRTALDASWYGPIIKSFLPVDDALIAATSADVFAASKRVAAANQVGRTFLMGDAVHLTNTRGGMNMNCGIHDAFALCNALAACYQGRADEQLLSECARERLQIASRELLARTDARVMSIDEWLAKAAAMAVDPAQAFEFMYQSSMLDIASLDLQVAHDREINLR